MIESIRKVEAAREANMKLDPRRMTAEEKEQLNQYHAAVYEKISPFLDRKEKAWLKQATRKIS